LEHQIFRFATMSLRDRCSTSYDLASLFRGRRSTLHRCRKKSQNALVRGRHLSTPLSILGGSLAKLLRFLMLSTSKIEDASQNCFVFDVVNRQICRKSPRKASFLSFQLPNFKEVSENSFVFKLADRQRDR
jgi:hypothetical protein